MPPTPTEQFPSQRLGVVGDAILRAPGLPGLNLSLWVASVADRR